MRTLQEVVLTIVLGTVAIQAHATTWVEVTVRDPITNERISVSQLGSSGSYIYQAPEKSDQVFWPYTDDRWLWFNLKSGYIAFGDDFENIDGTTRAVLKAWLTSNYNRMQSPTTRLEHLQWAERVYSERGMDDEFWCHFYRLMAFETRADSETSLKYVRKALPLLSKELDGAKNIGPKLAALYLLSEYNRRVGNTVESENYLEQLKSQEVPEDLASFKSYVLEIAREQRDPPSNNPLQRAGER